MTVRPECDADVAIVGAGAAGAAAAAVIGRGTARCVVIEPDWAMTPRFRAEKLEPDQAALLRKLGLLEPLLPWTAAIHEIQEARAGRLLARIRLEQYGISYHDLVNELRRQVPARVEVRAARLANLETGPEIQRLRLDDGSSLSARLVVLACGTGRALPARLGLARTMVSEGHSLCFGFTLGMAAARGFEADSLTCFGAGIADGVDALTLFPIREALRANLFTYWPASDPRVQSCRSDPIGLLGRLMPGLERLAGPLELSGKVEVYPIDLSRLDAPTRPGLVVLGDAFQSVCPATGTGLTKVLTDVDCLVSDHLPEWLSGRGMGLDKIRRFYADPRKRACDENSLAMALRMRRTAIDPSLRWRLRRAARAVKKELQAQWWRMRQVDAAVAPGLAPDDRARSA